MSRALPPRPDLDHLKAQAKDLLQEVRRRDAGAMDRWRPIIGPWSDRSPTLSQAQRVIAREYGFASWPKLKAEVERRGQAADPLGEVVRAFHAGDAAGLRRLLARHPEIRPLVNRPLPGAAFGGLPLTSAIKRADRALIDVLIEAGADLKARSDWWAGGFGVLDEAPADLVPFLLERGATLDAYNASRLGWIDRLTELVDRDPAVVRSRGGDGQTPLHVAGSVEVAGLLLDRGAEIDALDVDHESTPAQYLIGDHPEVARYLVERGARADLLLVAALGDLERSRALLDAEPGLISISISDRWFPRRDPRSGGTIYIWTLGWHRTPHLVAHHRGHHDLVNLLLDRSPASLRLSVACEIGDDARVAELLASSPNLLGSLPATDLARLPNAARGRDRAAVRRFLAAGWPVDAPAESGETALHWAAWHGEAALVRELLTRGARLDLRERQYQATALGWAVHGSINGWHRDEGDYGAVVAALLAGGATPAAGDAAGSAAVREAFERHREGADSRGSADSAGS